MSGELITIPEQPVNTAQPTPMRLMEMAMQHGDFQSIEKFMDMQDRWEATEARKAYNKAFACFKAEAVQIVKNVSVTDGPLKGKKYADLFAVTDSVIPALSKHGLSHSWKLTKDDPTWVEVTCVLRHELGHSETVSMGGAPDTGGAKNSIQARASSVSYLERYTLLAITGLSSRGGDLDGRDFGMTEDTFQKHMQAIREAKDIPALQVAYEAAKTAAKNDKPTLAAIIKAKDERKGALRCA